MIRLLNELDQGKISPSGNNPQEQRDTIFCAFGGDSSLYCDAPRTEDTPETRALIAKAKAILLSDPSVDPAFFDNVLAYVAADGLGHSSIYFYPDEKAQRYPMVYYVFLDEGSQSHLHTIMRDTFMPHGWEILHPIREWKGVEGLRIE